MKIHFYSISNDENVNFISDATFKDNVYEFLDLSCDNTKIKFHILDDNSILLSRNGDISMEVLLKPGVMTNGNYQNDIGFYLDFQAFTKEIRIENEKIVIYYDLYIDNILENSYKIYLLIK